MRLSLRLPPWPTSTLLIFSIISLSISAATVFSQPQNLEVFFPSTPPLFFSPSLNPPTSQSSYNNTKRPVAIAVVVTAVTTLIVVALILLLISLCRNKRRVRVKQNKFSEHVVNNTADRHISEPTTASAAVCGGVTAVKGGGIDDVNAVVASGVYKFGKFDGNLKGLIVDENGLDVVYWRKLEGMSSKNSFKKEVFKKADETDDKQLRLSRKISRRKETVQEIPLLRGKSSTSHIPLSPDSDEIGQFEPLEIERQESITIRSPPHPPSPPPVMAVNNTPPLKSKNPPPSPPWKNTMKPPPVPPVKAEDAGASSSSSSSSSSAVRMKPLQSVKIDNGSYRFDGDMMEALFGYVATNRKSPRTNTNTTRLVPRKPDH